MMFDVKHFLRLDGHAVKKKQFLIIPRLKILSMENSTGTKNSDYLGEISFCNF